MARLVATALGIPLYLMVSPVIALPAHIALTDIIAGFSSRGGGKSALLVALLITAFVGPAELGHALTRDLEPEVPAIAPAVAVEAIQSGEEASVAIQVRSLIDRLDAAYGQPAR